MSHTRIDKQRMMPSKTLYTSDPTDPDMKRTIASSAKKGTMRAPAKGHPTIVPSPNHVMPCAVFRPFSQSRNEARPSIDIYMVKVEGKNAVEA
jgi:hypothetical protein